MIKKTLKRFKKFYIDNPQNITLNEIKNNGIEMAYEIKSNALVGFIRKSVNESRIIILVIDFFPHKSVLSHYLQDLYDILQNELRPMHINLTVLEKVAACNREAWINSINGKALIELQIPIKKGDEPIQKLLNKIVMNVLDQMHTRLHNISKIEEKIEVNL